MTIAALRPLPSPPLAPELFTDGARNAWFLGLRLRRDHLWLQACDLEDQLGADRFLEFCAVLDRDHERAWPTDHAILVVEIELLDIHRRIGRLLHHHRQAV